MYKGVFPDEDPDGDQYREGTEGYEKRYQPLAGGMYATLFIIEADLDFIHKELGLPHYGSAQPCALCEANSTTLPWTDCRPGLHAWSGTIYSNPQWKASHPDAHALFSLTGVGAQNRTSFRTFFTPSTSAQISGFMGAFSSSWFVA